MVCLKHSGLWMSKKKSPDHFPGCGNHRDSEVADHRQVSFRHAVMRGIVPITRVFGNVIYTDYTLPGKCWMEDGRVTRHPKAVEGFFWCAGKGVQHKGF